MELAELKEKSKAINSDVDELKAQLMGYTSESQIEEDLSHVKETVNKLEKKLQEERERGIVKFSYTQAMTYYKNNRDIARSINPAVEFAIANEGDTAIFGTYPQNDKNKKEPIEWTILAKEGGKCLIISRYALDRYSYDDSNSTTWENCSLRKWLNESFYQKAFSTVEQSVIATSTVRADRNPKFSTDPGNDTSDKVFLLSIAEVNKYFSSDKERECCGTSYCYARGALKSYSNGNTNWWLRSPGRDENIAAGVYDTGSVHISGFLASHRLGIRPVLWINLDPLTIM